MRWPSTIIGNRRFDDQFIHPRIHGDPDSLYRARILVSIFLVAIPIIFALTAALMIIEVPWEFLSLLLPVNLSSFAAMVAFLGILKWHGHVNLCCQLAVLLAVAEISYGIAITGGPDVSPMRQLLFLPCLMSFLFGGIRVGVATLVICVLALVAMTTWQEFDFEFQKLQDDAFLAWGTTAALAVNLLIASVLAFAYEYMSVTLRRERDREYRKYIELSRKDPLTGLANRRVFDEFLQSRVELYARMPSKPCFVLCYLDLDKFKPINDTYGHDIGDEVLAAVSTRLMSALRGADFIGRHGGDEFLMLFDGVESRSTIAALGGRLLELIRAPISTRVGSLEVDASLGFAAYPRDGRDANSLRNATDAAMYEAKRSGCGFHIHGFCD